MKNFTLTAILIVSLSPAFATVLTVSNDINSPGEYTSLQDAIDAASAEDTIYVSGTQTSYGSVTVDKKLTLIGAGYHPNNQFGFSTIIESINFTSPDASGSEISGFVFQGHEISASVANVNDVIIKRNWVNVKIDNGGTLFSGWKIHNNILENVNFSNANICEIKNNIITGTINYSASTGLMILNNIFIGYTHDAFYSISNATIENNIFYGPTPGGTSNCVFNNNINSGAEEFLPTGTTNTGSGNMESTDPQFILTGNEGDPFEYANNYNLDVGSPGIAAGTDDTDIGIYGGTLYIFPNAGDAPWLTSAMPEIPQVIEMNILNTAIPAGGTLNVQVKARKQD